MSFGTDQFPFGRPCSDALLSCGSWRIHNTRGHDFKYNSSSGTPSNIGPATYAFVRLLDCAILKHSALMSSCKHLSIVTVIIIHLSLRLRSQLECYTEITTVLSSLRNDFSHEYVFIFLKNNPPHGFQNHPTRQDVKTRCVISISWSSGFLVPTRRVTSPPEGQRTPDGLAGS